MLQALFFIMRPMGSVDVLLFRKRIRNRHKQANLSVVRTESGCYNDIVNKENDRYTEEIKWRF